LQQLFFRLPELIVRPQQFGGAFGDSPFERRVQGSDLALGPLMVGNLSLGRTEQRRLGFLSLAQVAGDQHEHGFAVAFNRGGVDLQRDIRLIDSSRRPLEPAIAIFKGLRDAACHRLGGR
jgi:hypothetical protein